jgi:hypothetical protein
MPQGTVINAPIAAFPGMNADTSDSGDNYISRVSGETTLQIPFGRAVLQGATDGTCVSLTTSANLRKILGVVAYNAFNQIPSQLGTVADANSNIGLLAGAPVRIKQRGRLYVAITENVDPSLTVRLSIDATGGGIGTFRTTTSAGHTILLSNCAKWGGTFTSVQGFAILDYDFRMIAGATAE